MFLFLAFALAAKAFAADATAHHGIISGTITSQASVFYDTSANGCDKYDVPDEPARAFRDGSGLIHFIATNSNNRAMVGGTFSDLKHACQIIFKGGHNSDPGAYDDYGWLAGFYAQDDLVFALVHNEFHGHERPLLCHSGDYGRCWENSITAVISKNGGYNFTEFDSHAHMIAALPYRYIGDQAGQFGYFNPTNILKKGMFFYFLFSAIDRIDSGRSGICIARTADLLDPKSYVAWDGAQFATRFIDPYTASNTDPIAHTCVPIAAGHLFFSLGDILWMPSTSRYVAVTRCQIWDVPVHCQTPGAYLSTSVDLINWSGPVLLLADDRDVSGKYVPQLYPSLIDPDSNDQNFGTTGKNALLLTVTSVPGKGYTSWRLWSRRVELKLQP